MIHFKIATPERVMLETEVNSVTLPTQTGEITVLPGHIPLVSNLTPGEVRYKIGVQEEFFAVSGGVIEVRAGSEVIVLADTAEFGHEIDEQRAQEARERARVAMRQSYGSEKASASALAGLEKHLARIRVVRKHRTKTHKNLESGTLNQ